MAEDLKGLVQRFYAQVGEGNLAVVDELVADDFVEHEAFPGLEPNKEGVRQFFAMFKAAFPDMSMTPDQTVAEGEMVFVRATFRGTHEGEFMGIPATGKEVEVAVFDQLRFRDGQVAEHWGLMDAMGLMQQLGAVPAPAPA